MQFVVEEMEVIDLSVRGTSSTSFGCNETT